MTDRSQIAANVLGSLRLEGLEPDDEARALAEAWARGDASDDDLREAERRLLAGEPLDDLLARVVPTGAPRAA